MNDLKSREEMEEQLGVLLNEQAPYPKRLEAYEYLCEDCEPIVESMLAKLYETDGDTGKMLIEVLSNYKGNKGVYMGLVSYLYKGDDVALFARLLGSYGDESAIEVLKSFAEEYELNYNEFMEVRNAVEQLGGYFEQDKDFSDDPFYRYIKGLDEEERDSRNSPFERIFSDGVSDRDRGSGSCDGCLDSSHDCDCARDAHSHDCDCHD